MCGRFALMQSWEEIHNYFSIIPAVQPELEMPPRYNIAPTQPVLMVGNGDGGRRSQLVRWGLVPAWVKDPKTFTLLLNARSETAIEKPSFRNAMRHRRTLLPATGFYEWKRLGKGQKSQAYWVRPKNGGLMAFGALVETWGDPNGSEIDTGCILTTASNDSFQPIHHRLPVIISPREFDRWLDCKTQEPREVADLFKPVNDDFLEAIPVGDEVNKVANTSPSIQNKIILKETQTTSETIGGDADQFTLF